MEDIDKNLDNLFGDNDDKVNPQISDLTDKPQISVKTDNLEKPAPELLNNEQRLIILKRWEQDNENPPSIEELVKLAFPDVPNLDGRSRQGRAVKSYLANKDLKPRTKTEYQPKGLLTLTEEQKEFIRNNPNMRANEIAQALWNNLFFANNSQEVLTVKNYQQELEKENKGFKRTVEDDDFETFRPPKTFDHACARINKHVHGANYDSKKLTPTQKKQCLTLISHMHNPRFAHHMGLTNNADDRRLFENTFVKYIYDKTDLSQEDLDQYLTLANEAVMESSIKRTISMLENEQQTNLNNTGKILMTIVEALKTSRDEYNACIKRQQALYKTLETERSKRLNERVGPQFTLLNIVEEMKNEERRKVLVAEAEKRNDKLKGEIARLSEMDEMICRIYGVDEDLIING